MSHINTSINMNRATYEYVHGTEKTCIAKITGRCVRAEWRLETYRRHETGVHEIEHRKQTTEYVQKPSKKRIRAKLSNTMNSLIRHIRGSLCLSLAISYVHQLQYTTTTRQRQQLTHHIIPHKNADSSATTASARRSWRIRIGQTLLQL